MYSRKLMPELIVDIYNKYVAGDIQGSLQPSIANCASLASDGASFPVAAKRDMAIMRDWR